MEYRNLMDVAYVLYGFPCNASKFNTDNVGRPVARIRDVLSGHSGTYSDEDIPNEYILSCGDLLVGMDGNFHVGLWHDEGAILCQRVCKIYSKDTDVVINTYLRHLLVPLIKQIENSKESGTVKHLLDRDLRALLIPIPKINVQRYIANTLNKMSDLFDDFYSGIPAEIAARQKQYEYYRDKLLSFTEAS